jgi:hypothetical protein
VIESAPHRPGGALRGSSPRTVAALAATVVFVALVAWGAVEAVRQIGELGERRDDAIAARPDGADVAGSAGDAFRSFRATLHPGERFALVFGPDTSVDERGTYRLVALSYLYPAIAVDDPHDAQAVMVFGEPTEALRSSFGETGVVDDVWLGHRP